MTVIQTAEITSLDEIDMEVVAKHVAETLCKHYPDHFWVVGWHLGNNIVIKNMAVSTQIGRVIHYPDCADWGDLEKRVMRAGGALLELAGMDRGRWDGELPQKLDGMDPLEFHLMLRKEKP